MFQNSDCALGFLSEHQGFQSEHQGFQLLLLLYTLAFVHVILDDTLLSEFLTQKPFLSDLSSVSEQDASGVDMQIARVPHCH